MNNLHKERLEQFFGRGGNGEEKWRSVALCKIMNYYEECSLATPIYAFSKCRKKKKVMLTELKQHIQSSHNEIFLHVTANEMVDL